MSVFAKALGTSTAVSIQLFSLASRERKFTLGEMEELEIHYSFHSIIFSSE